MPRSPHRSGHAYRTARAQMFAIYGRVCIHCGHDGSIEADHIMPVSLDPDQPVDPHAMRPSHGSNGRCPTCGRACNRERSNKIDFVMFRPALTW